MMPLSQLSEDNLLRLAHAILSKPGPMTAEDELDLVLVNEAIQQLDFAALLGAPMGNA